MNDAPLTFPFSGTCGAPPRSCRATASLAGAQQGSEAEAGAGPPPEAVHARAPPARGRAERRHRRSLRAAGVRHLLPRPEGVHPLPLLVPRVLLAHVVEHAAALHQPAGLADA
eukprot:CAMPEP_0119146996 /NCGR_PEP_ID=MMETSP1310-20130426/39729_1 /TAXON_ID=464262 /ORGANISM="Genus nov. species nov., Strain RCC2339" /LENGTH=112 /DNA_ID=CAMNT_0007138925 /DNA_START=36 /DNA_END=370 /DNA_ORIENTATION=+